MCGCVEVWMDDGAHRCESAKSESVQLYRQEPRHHLTLSDEPAEPREGVLLGDEDWRDVACEAEGVEGEELETLAPVGCSSGMHERQSREVG